MKPAGFQPMLVSSDKNTNMDKTKKAALTLKRLP